ncbi:kinase-like domain-containing protein [Chytriomyces sp. MP71]|nr:kinase-like domain-containing protein [Chytriomyces sp. MP71]
MTETDSPTVMPLPPTPVLRERERDRERKDGQRMSLLGSPFLKPAFGSPTASPGPTPTSARMGVTSNVGIVGSAGNGTGVKRRSAYGLALPRTSSSVVSLSLGEQTLQPLQTFVPQSPSLRAVFIESSPALKAQSQALSIKASTKFDDENDEQDHQHNEDCDLVFVVDPLASGSLKGTPALPSSPWQWYHSPSLKCMPVQADPVLQDYDDIDDDDHLALDINDDFALDANTRKGSSIKISKQEEPAGSHFHEETLERFTFASLTQKSEIGTQSLPRPTLTAAVMPSTAVTNATASPQNALSSSTSESSMANTLKKFTLFKDFKSFAKFTSSIMKRNSVPNLRATKPETHNPTRIKASPLGFLALVADHYVPSRQKKMEYRHLKILGHGVQGTVSLRLHNATGAIVALKSMGTVSLVDGNVRASFRREVEILQRTRAHPNIIRLLDFWEGKEKVYQVFEICSGGDLENALPKLVPEEEGAWMMAPILDAVRYLHGQNILHRDIRPANVLLRKPLSGNESLQELMTIPVLADFGIACYISGSGRLGSQFMKRPAHIAPDVLDGARFRKSSDMYGVGVCLVHILLGRAIELDDQEPRLLAMRDPRYNALSEEGKQFLNSLINVDPAKRLKAREAGTAAWMVQWGIAFQGPEIPHPSPKA